MASTSKKPSFPPPAAQRKSRKTNKANLHASQNDELTVVGIGASESFAPPSMLINEKHAILHISKTARRYLDQPSGAVSTDLLKLAHPELELKLRAALPQVFKNNWSIVTPPIPIQFNGHAHQVILSIKLLASETEKRALVFFLEDEQAETLENEPLRQSGTDVRQLHEQLQSIDHEYLSAREELDESSRKISRASELFYALFDTNPIPTVLIRQEDEVFLHANGEFLNYFQVESSEVIGHSATEFSFDLGLRSNKADEIRSQLKEIGRVRNLEFEIKHPSGETRIILASLQVLILDETNALITTFIDITERVHAEQQIRALAAELTGTEQAERHRLSQILHDDLQQRLFAVQMQLSFLSDAYEKNDLKAVDVDFPQVEEWLAEAIKVTRQLSVDLSPPILHGEGLVEAVIWLASQMDEKYGLKVDIKSNGTPAELEEKVRVLIFYAIRELLFNIVKHAKISEAAVRFEHDTHRLLVIVRDRGTGFNNIEVMNDPKMAHGLLIIRHRLNLLGCNLEVKSQPGSGTEAIIEVPYGHTDT